MGLSDRTISKWERGHGCPDISLISQLSEILGVEIKEILSGDITENDRVRGNMKNSKYFICKSCGNIVISTGGGSISCCGRKLEEMEAKKASPEQRLIVEDVEDEWFISSEHPMTKDNYIFFVAYATGEKLEIIKQYPEWNLQVRIFKRGHGMLLWHSTDEGLMYQLI